VFGGRISVCNDKEFIGSKQLLIFCIKPPLHAVSALSYMWYDTMCHIKTYTIQLTIADDLVALLHRIPELPG